MKRFLLPRRVWVRVLSWLPLFSVLYMLLLKAICLVADAIDGPPPHTIFWLSAGLIFAFWGVLLSPLALMLVWLAAIFCPHRARLSMADYIALVLSFLAIMAWGVFVYLTLCS